MATQIQAKHLIPVIEEAVQLWHFVQITRKYASIIVKDESVYTKFKERAELVKTKHMSVKREIDSLDELLEEMEDIRTGAEPLVVRQVINAFTKPEPVPKLPEKETKLSEKPYALLRSIHSLMIEMDARLKRVESKISSTDH